MHNGTMVLVIGQDEATVNRLTKLASMLRLDTAAYSDAETCLQQLSPERAVCLFSEFVLPGLSGLELQAKLKEHGVRAPVVFLSSHGTTTRVVQAMRQGAMTVLDRACRDQELWDALCHAQQLDAERRRSERERLLLERRLRLLTLRERQVAELVAVGRKNREIAAELGLALRTVEGCRQQLHEKLQVRSVAEIVRILMEVRLDQLPVAANK